MSRVSVITNRGVSVVRSAQSKLKTVSIVDCLTSSHFENQPNELATKPFSWYDGVVGQVKSVKSGGNHLKVQITFPQTKDNQPLKSIGIRIKADDDDRLFILYAESDGNSAVTLGSEFTCDYEIPINVSSDTIEDVGSEPVPGLEDYYTKSEIDADLENYYTKEQINGTFLNKVSYNADTNSLDFASEDGARTVSVSLD